MPELRVRPEDVSMRQVEAEKMQEEEQKEAAAREYQKEMARKEAEARQDEERKRLARERELAAIALREEQKQQLEAIFAHQEEIVSVVDCFRVFLSVAGCHYFAAAEQKES